MVMTPSQAANRTGKASSTRGRDTIGAGSAVHPKGRDHVPDLGRGKSNVATELPQTFDTRSNTSSGEPHDAAYEPTEGAAKVAKVMLRQGTDHTPTTSQTDGSILPERPRLTDSKTFGLPRGIKTAGLGLDGPTVRSPTDGGGNGHFRIGENQARVIDHDKAPE